MKVYVMQNKSGTMTNVDMNAKKMVDWRSCEKSYMWNPSTYDCGRDKTCGLALHKKMKFSIKDFFQ